MQRYYASCVLLAWIKNFLTDRQQSTRVGDVLSDTVKIMSGIIQGSCSGPVFVLYINSITKVFLDSVTCLLFAYDVKIYSVSQKITPDILAVT